MTVVINGSTGLSGPNASGDTLVNGVTVGRGAGAVATNTAVGASALAANTTGAYNTAIGELSLTRNTSGNLNTAVGRETLTFNTTGVHNTAIGHDNLYANTTGSYNTALGSWALQANTTASNNTAVGYQAGYSQTTGGALAGYNTFIGRAAGFNTTGTQNQFFGESAGNLITSGSKNTIIGSYNGNQGGLDIRTSSNRIVLSDGDGFPMAYAINAGTKNWIFGGIVATAAAESVHAIGQDAAGTEYCFFASASTTGTAYAMRMFSKTTPAVVGSITFTGSATAYNTSSDYRLKNITGSLTGYKERVMSLQPKQGTWIADGAEFRGFLAHEFAAPYRASVVGEKDAVDEDGKPVMQAMQASSSEVMADLIALIQEQQAIITALTARITALEGN